MSEAQLMLYKQGLLLSLTYFYPSLLNSCSKYI